MKARLWSLKVLLLILFTFTLVNCTSGVVPNFSVLNSSYSFPFVDGGSFDGSPGYLSNPSKAPALATYNNQLYLVSGGNPSGGVQSYLYNGNDNFPSWMSGGNTSFQPTPGLASNPSLTIYNGLMYGTWSEINMGGNPDINQIFAGTFNGTTWTNDSGASSCGGANCLSYAANENANSPVIVASAAGGPGVNIFWSEAAGGGYFNVRGVNSSNGVSAWTQIMFGSNSYLNVGTNTAATSPQAVIFSSQVYVAWSENGPGNTGPSQIHVDSSSDGVTFDNVDLGVPVLSQSGTGNAATPFLAVNSDALFLSWIGNYGGANLVRVAKLSGTWSYVDSGSLNFNPSMNASGTPKMVTGADNNLYVTWTESNSAEVTQVRVARYNGGTSWTFVDGGGPMGLNFNTSINTTDPSLTLFNGKIYSSWEEFNSGYPDLSRVRVIY